jgi:hypothetical protein
VIVVVAVAVAALVVAVTLVVVVVRRSRPRDGVELFQRQIDALSAEARRPVVERVHALRHDDEPGRGTPSGS